MWPAPARLQGGSPNRRAADFNQLQPAFRKLPNLVRFAKVFPFCSVHILFLSCGCEKLDSAQRPKRGVRKARCRQLCGGAQGGAEQFASGSD
jgi:hypothetical protein